MSGFIAGPILKISVDEAGLVASVQEALGKIATQVATTNKQNSQAITASVVNPLIAQAAQLRALYSTGSIGIKDLQVQQKALVASLDVQIKQLATRNDLDKQSLATLKQLTLERERQQNALNRGVGVGVTAGTTSALSTVSGPIIANISKLGTGLLGLAGGSQGETTAFAAAAAGISSIAVAGGVASSVVGGLAIVLVGAAAAATALAVSGGNVAERLSNISQRTGISIQNLQILEAVAKVSELGLEDLVVGFRKFSQALTGGDGSTGPDGFDSATQKSAEILKALGVTSKDSFTAIEQVADAFQNLPDGPTKAATAIQLFGRSGLQLIPILNQGSAGVEKFRAIVEQFAPSVNQDAINSQNNWQIATEKLSLAFDSLKVTAIPVLDILSKLTTSAAELLNVTEKNPKGVLSGILSGILQGGGSEGSTIAAISANLGTLSTTSRDTTANFGVLTKGFAAADAAGKKLTNTLDPILNGTLDKIRELAKQGAQELQALNDEAGKAALSKLNEFTLAGERQNPNATAADNILTKQRQDLEAIAEIMLNFPNLANQVSGAVAGVTNSTILALQKEADAALKKADDASDAESKQRIENERKLNELILGVDDDIAIARAQSTKDGVAAIIAEEQKRLDDTIAKATLLGATEQQLQNLRVALNQEANDKIARLRQDELDKTNKEVQQEAGQLFDALVRGGGSFTTALKNSLQNLLLAPVKQVFSAVVGAIFTPFVQATKDALKNLGDSLKGQGGILGAIGKNLSPDTAIGKNSASVNLNTTSTDNNTQALNNLTGALTGTTPTKIPGATATSSGGGFGNILFGGAGGGGGLIFHGLPTGNGTGGSANPFGALLSGPSGILLGAGNLFGGLGNHNVGQAVGGGITILGGGLSTIGQQLAKVNPGGIGSTLGQVGGVLGGAGLVISGVSQGGLGGAASAALGGAEIGTAIAPGIGTAIGAVAGFVAGLVGGLFGHKGPSQAQIASAIKRQTIDPNMFVGQEFDRSAQGTFGQTLNTTFSEGPGGTFSNAAINGPSQAPIVNISMPINSIDSQDTAKFIAKNAQTIAQHVGKQINSTQSGLARNVRAIVSPA